MASQAFEWQPAAADVTYSGSYYCSSQARFAEEPSCAGGERRERVSTLFPGICVRAQGGALTPVRLCSSLSPRPWNQKVDRPTTVQVQQVGETEIKWKCQSEFFFGEETRQLS
jgi:hypothetical protein